MVQVAFTMSLVGAITTSLISILDHQRTICWIFCAGLLPFYIIGLFFIQKALYSSVRVIIISVVVFVNAAILLGNKGIQKFYENKQNPQRCCRLVQVQAVLEHESFLDNEECTAASAEKPVSLTNEQTREDLVNSLIRMLPPRPPIGGVHRDELRVRMSNRKKKNRISSAEQYKVRLFKSVPR